jgi:uncharacterized membrane protein YgcG
MIEKYTPSFNSTAAFIKLLVAVFVGLIISCSTDRKIKSGFQPGRIIDYAHLLDQPQQDSILSLINKLDHDIGSQIAILIVDTLGNEKLEEFSLRMAKALKLGRSTHNDGLLITVVMRERKMRVEVGTGLENIIKDEIASRIIREDIAPLFRQEKYGRGIYVGVDKISRLITENKQLVGTNPR